MNHSPAIPTREGVLEEPSKASKVAQLRQLMREREIVETTLMALDFRIWALEEFFREGGQ